MTTKAELAREARRYAGITHRAAADSVDAVIGAIAETLAKGGRVELRGLGTFEVKTLPEKECRALLSETKTIPAHRRIGFRPCEKLRRAVWDLPPEAKK